MLEDITTLLGGRVAEEIIFGQDNVSTGAESDIRMATSIARRMVTEWGMNQDIGPMALEEPDGEVFLGYSMSKRKAVSDEMASKIDREIRAIIDEAYQRSQTILTENRNELEALAQALLEYETLTGDEIKAVIRGEKIVREEPGVHVSSRTTVPVSDPDDPVKVDNDSPKEE